MLVQFTGVKMCIRDRSSIMEADQIIVLNEGKVVGHGKHHQLLKECSIYREIAISQLSEEELGYEKEA